MATATCAIRNESAGFILYKIFIENFNQSFTILQKYKWFKDSAVKEEKGATLTGAAICTKKWCSLTTVQYRDHHLLETNFISHLDAAKSFSSEAHSVYFEKCLYQNLAINVFINWCNDSETTFYYLCSYTCLVLRTLVCLVWVIKEDLE